MELEQFWAVPTPNPAWVHEAVSKLERDYIPDTKKGDDRFSGRVSATLKMLERLAPRLPNEEIAFLADRVGKSEARRRHKNKTAPKRVYTTTELEPEEWEQLLIHDETEERAKTMKDTTFDDRMRAAEEALLKRRGSRVPPPKPRGTAGVDAKALNKLLENYADKEYVKGAAEQIRRDLNDIIKNLPEFQDKKVLEVVTQVGDKVGQIKGMRHMMFEKLVKAAYVAGPGGHRKNIMLKGPMGSGKSTAGKQLAKLMDLPFHYLGQTEMPHNVVGHVHPTTNEFMHTPFTRAFIEGGVVMFEEMDSWSPRATLVTNVPLANGYITLDDGSQHNRHKDCIIIACTNTWGTGATTEYVGRNKLDAAFLDRFAIKMDWVYDPQLERAAANHDEVVDVVQQARFNADHYGVKITISPRSSIDIADMVRSGFTMREALNMNFLSACDKEQRKMLLEGIDL